jgi:hypothetical protein
LNNVKGEKIIFFRGGGGGVLCGLLGGIKKEDHSFEWSFYTPLCGLKKTLLSQSLFIPAL